MRRAPVVAVALLALVLPSAAGAVARLAYVYLPPESTAHRQPVLWAVDADGTHRTRLLREPGIGTPAWSPNGKTVAVEICAQWTNGCRWPSLQLVNAATGTRRLLLRGDFEPVQWSPDGTRLLLSRPVRAGADVSDISVVDLSGRRRLVAESAVDPSWSPNGRQIVYQFGPTPESGDIDVFDLRTGRSRALTHAGYETSPVWSPDGSAIAFVDGGGHPMLAIAWLAGTGYRVVQDDADAGDLHWLSNRLIGYSRTVWGANGSVTSASLATYDILRRRRHVIAYGSGAADWCTGHGGEVAYTTGDTAYNFGPRKVWLLPASGGTPRRLTSGGYGDDPQVSPDCSAVALTDNVDEPVITTVVLAGSKVRTHRVGVGRELAWRPSPPTR